MLLGLFCTGCTTSLNLSEVPKPDEIILEVPKSLALEDEFGNTLGFATQLRPSIFVAPDHLWQTAGELYYKNHPIEVLARDFRHDILFFTVPEAVFVYNTGWSSNPPGVGQALSWQEDLVLAEATVFSAKADFAIGNTAVEDLMQIDVATSPGNSGKPLFNVQTNRIYGMLVATDTIKDVSYFVRSDVILTLAAEYLD